MGLVLALAWVTMGWNVWLVPDGSHFINSDPQCPQEACVIHPVVQRRRPLGL